MNLHTNSEKFVIATDIIGDKTWGAYVISSANPSVEYYYIGGFDSPEKVRERLDELLEGKDKVSEIEVYTRPPLRLDPTVALMEEKDIQEAITENIKESIKTIKEFKVNKTTIFKILFSSKNILIILVILGIYLFWTKNSISIPGDISLPLIEKGLAGSKITARSFGEYFPLLLLLSSVLYSWHVLKHNIDNDYKRKLILVLALKYKWRVQHFTKLIPVQIIKSGLNWVYEIADVINKTDPASLQNLEKKLETHHTQDAAADALYPGSILTDQISFEDELQEKKSFWYANEFRRRIHNLYFLDKEKDYKKGLLFFDPLTYIFMSKNRVAEYLSSKGISYEIVEVPIDPHSTDRLTSKLFIVYLFLRLIFFGWLLFWSFRIASDQPVMLLIINIMSALLVLVVPFVLNFQAIVKKAGFPKAEPLGAYTVGLVGEKLSIY